MRSMLVAVALVLLLAGCTGNADAKPAPARSVAPASAAGGACQLLEFPTVNAKLGLALDVAAAASQDNSFTCVLQTHDTGYPDLILSVSSTIADAGVFSSTIQPKDAVAVAGLGVIGYQIPTPAAAKAGPGVRVGWLTGNRRLIELSLRLRPDASPDDVTRIMPKMVELAKLIDLSSL